MLRELIAVLLSTADFSPSGTEASVSSWIKSSGYNTGTVMNAFRLVIVGALRGPRVYDIISWIGREETIKRIEKGISIIGSKKK